MVRSVTAALVSLFVLSSAASAATITVEVSNFKFVPENIVINEGDTVHWTWIQGSHNVRAAAGQIETFVTPVQGPPATFDFTFNDPGAVNYYCQPHGSDLGGGNVDGMTGSITVIPAGNAPSAGATGSCPGVVNIQFSGTPNGQMAVVTGTSQGASPLPGGPCPGLVTEMSGLTFRGMFGLNGAGDLTLSPNLPGAACELYVQGLDVSTCTLTNLAVLP